MKKRKIELPKFWAEFVGALAREKIRFSQKLRGFFFFNPVAQSFKKKALGHVF